jgi:hypothetical protein
MIYLCFLITLFSAVSARAGTVTLFTDRNVFLGAATNLQNITFEGIAPPNSVTPPLASLTLLGVTFSDSPQDIFVVDAGFFAPTFQFGSGASLSGGVGMTVQLPSGITAVGSDIMTALTTGPFQIVLSTGETFTVTPGTNGVRNFAGLISDVPISSLRFNRTAGIPLFDNFVFGQGVPAPVSEPATITLMAAGFGAVLLKRRRRVKR